MHTGSRGSGVAAYGGQRLVRQREHPPSLPQQQAALVALRGHSEVGPGPGLFRGADLHRLLKAVEPDDVAVTAHLPAHKLQVLAEAGARDVEAAAGGEGAGRQRDGVRDGRGCLHVHLQPTRPWMPWRARAYIGVRACLMIVCMERQRVQGIRG
jgi:hypothetical protein